MSTAQETTPSSRHTWGPWALHGNGRTIAPGAVVAADERLTWPRTIGIGVQHVVAMFGATLLVPVLTGFPVPTTLLFSGLGTLIFLLITRNRVPSYLGSSFAFIAPLTAIGTSGGGHAAQLGGVIAVGIAMMLIGLGVRAAGVRVVDAVMPPVVTGTIVALIGLNLAPVSVADVQKQPLVAGITLAATLLAMVAGPGMLGRLSMLVGVITGWIAATLLGELDPAAVSQIRATPWLGLPELTGPSFEINAVLVSLPVIVVLVAENLGHIKAVSAMTGKNVDDLAGHALFADGLATTLAGSAGGSGTTTYAENIGVMAATKVFSTAAYWVAGLVAIGLAFVPKFGALVLTVPSGVLGGATLLLYGMIGMLGIRIWQNHAVDFTDPVNLATASVGLIVGIGNLTLSVGSVELQGIAWGSVGVILAYPVLRVLGQRTRRREERAHRGSS